MVEIPQGWGPTQTHVCPPSPPPRRGHGNGSLVWLLYPNITQCGVRLEMVY